jgi:membrane protease YdiL (CAAX protease family)
VKSTASILLRLAAIFVLPVLLIATGVLPFGWRFAVLLAMTLAAATVAWSRHSLDSLGFRRATPGTWMLWSIMPAIFLAGAFLLQRHPRPHEGTWFYAFFVLVSAPAQEFLYRGFLFAELGTLRLPSNLIVTLSAVLFSFMHVIYRDPLTVALTLAAGLGWALVYQSTRRFPVVALSHAAIGAVAIFLGVV